MSKRKITGIVPVWLDAKDTGTAFSGVEVETDDGTFCVWEGPGDWGDDPRPRTDTAWFVVGGDASWETCPQPLSQRDSLEEMLAAIIAREEDVPEDHTGHEKEDVYGYPHSAVCVTCSTEEREVLYRERGR